MKIIFVLMLFLLSACHTLRTGSFDAGVYELPITTGDIVHKGMMISDKTETDYFIKIPPIDTAMLLQIRSGSFSQSIIPSYPWTKISVPATDELIAFTLSAKGKNLSALAVRSIDFESKQPYNYECDGLIKKCSGACLCQYPVQGIPKLSFDEPVTVYDCDEKEYQNQTKFVPIKKVGECVIFILNENPASPNFQKVGRFLFNIAKLAYIPAGNPEFKGNKVCQPVDTDRLEIIYNKDLFSDFGKNIFRSCKKFEDDYYESIFVWDYQNGRVQTYAK